MLLVLLRVELVLKNGVDVVVVDEIVTSGADEVDSFVEYFRCSCLPYLLD